MSICVAVVDAAGAEPRHSLVESLKSLGIEIVDDAAMATIVIARDQRALWVRTLSGEDAQLSPDIAARDLAVLVRTLQALSDARRDVHLSETAGRLGLGASQMVHDANNALLPIVFAGRELLELGPRGAVLARQVLDSADHLGAMFREFLNAAGAGAATEPIDLNSEVLRMLPRLQALAGNSVDVSTRLAEQVPRVLIEPSELDRVLMNLVANARDSAVDPSPVVISTSVVLLDQPDAFGLPAGRWVLLEVEDQGWGMDPLTLVRAGEPFFTTKQAAHGTGLGLSSVLRSVRKARGYLRIESTEGVGTHVRVFLPT